MKMKIAAFALSIATLTGAMTAATSQAQAGHRWGAGLGVGLAAGALIGAAAASNAYAGPAYVSGPAYRDCRIVKRMDAWGYWHRVRICDAY